MKKQILYDNKMQILLCLVPHATLMVVILYRMEELIKTSCEQIY